MLTQPVKKKINISVLDADPKPEIKQLTSL